MRFEPYEAEYAAVPAMTDTERLDYFLLRVFETEEIWGLKTGTQWWSHRVADDECLPLWPYRRYALEAALDEWYDGRPDSISMEYFLYQTLPSLDDGIVLEIMPSAGRPGCRIRPAQLLSILEGMLEAGEYRLEG
mgnify:CR=1 FL=1